MKKIGTNKLIKQTIMMAVLTIVLASSIFAWFSKQQRDYNIVFQTGNLSVEATLYQFPNGRLEPKEEVTNPLVLNNVVSGDDFEFLLDIKNKSTIRGKLTVSFHLSYTNEDFLDVFDFYVNGELNNYAMIDNRLVIFEKILLVGESEMLYFDILVNQFLTNEHFGETLTIDYVEVRLEQIPN